MKKYRIITIFALLLLVCGKKEPQEQAAVIARVGDREITLAEFIRRAEYTIRPPYLKGNYYLHKKMILNSLLAEKMLALEAGTDNELYRSPEFQNYIQGRKEQAMRKWLYLKEGFDKVKLTDEQVRNAYRWAGREYKVAYFSLPSKSLADSVQKMLNTPGVSFEDAYRHLTGENVPPTRDVKWDREGNDAIIDALYSDTLRVGQVVGPIRIDEKWYMALKILGWNESIAVTDEQIKMRLRDVKERLARREAEKIYEKFVLKVMKGKTVKFDEKTFFKLVDVVKPFYVVSPEDKEKLFNAKFWGDDQQQRQVQIDENSFEEIKDWPLLTIDGQVWTVERLRDEMSRHPLVFRKKNLTDRNFPEQFKLAVVDLIRDKYLTREAYKRKYDRVPEVVQQTYMWQDHALALWQQQKYLRETGCKYNFYKDYMKVLDEYMNAYVDSLQKKYSDKVEIDMDMLEDVKLTRIDMFVIEKNVPYPIMVPSFPVVTTDSRIDYGKNIGKRRAQSAE
ncbi:MAG: hypothetical protein ONA69_02175 [candidate division KSB1 bacterium]|nr:hypothetical protein [candidate division KSB1 bacterium]